VASTRRYGTSGHVDEVPLRPQAAATRSAACEDRRVIDDNGAEVQTAGRSQSRAFVFLAKQNMMTENNLRVGNGRIFSASWGLFPDRAEELATGKLHWRTELSEDPAHGGFMSPFGGSQLAGSDATFRMESDAERIRFERHPGSPSRLSGLFLFPDRATAETVSHVHHWDIAELAEVSVTPLRVSVQDMEIASLARSMYAGGLVTPEMADRLWDAYWSGQTVNALNLVPPRCSITELLIDGWIDVVAT
jgi:hypothetical protein